jgi:hypothetical protein
MWHVKKYFVLWTATCFLFSSASLAAKIAQVKDKKVLITLEGESTAVGNTFFAMNAQGKKVAIIKITQVKGDKALGEISQGSARPGYLIAPRTPGGGGSSGTASAGSSDSYYDRKLSQRDHNGNSWGVVGGYLMNTMTATFVSGTPITSTRITANMTGSGFGALGYYDYLFSPTIALRGMTGVEQYKVSGSIATADCAATTTCMVDLNYMSFYGYGRWIFLPGKYKSWVGGGFGYLYAIGKSSTVLRQDQISANQIFVFSLGTDIRLSAKNYIPVTLEYGLFPSSDSVKASIIYLRAGYAWNL